MKSEFLWNKETMIIFSHEPGWINPSHRVDLVANDSIICIFLVLWLLETPANVAMEQGNYYHSVGQSCEVG